MKRLLDLYGKAGGASVGLAMAGFEVYGCDIERQPNYPFCLFEQDALTIPLDGLSCGITSLRKRCLVLQNVP